MKKTGLFIATSLILLLFLHSCGSSADLKSDLSRTEVEDLLQTNQFQFFATRAYPLDQTVTNIMQAMDATGSAYQILNLHDHYNLTLRDKKVKGDLPFFGRRYRASYSSDDKEFKIDFKNAFIEKSKKKNRTTYLIRPGSGTHTVIEKLYLEVYPNGKASLSISANDRQSISYSGYIIHLPDTP